jgi:hypothetical protein
MTRIEMENHSNNIIVRLYNRKHYHLSGSIHEQVVPLAGIDKVIKNVPIVVAHHGYVSEYGKVAGKLERNERLLKKELLDNPNDPYLLYQLGKSYFCDNRDLPKACEYFEKALSQQPNVRLDYVYNLAECYGYALINTEQAQKALSHMDKYGRDYKSKPAFRFLLGHVYLNNSMPIEAVEAFESCIGAGGVDYMGITSYLSYFNIGIILECMEMLEDASQMYDKCGDYPPAVERRKALL